MSKSKESNKSQIDDTHENCDEFKVQAPDGGYGWVVLVASFFISFILDGVMYSFGIILDEIKATYYDTEEDLVNLLSSFNTGFLFCSGPIVAGLTNQFGCRTVVMGGAVITAMMYLLTAFAPNIGIMMVTYGIIGGVSTGCTYIASLIIIPEYFDKNRGIATGITMAGSGVGSFVFAPLISLIIKYFDWKFTMSMCACVIFEACVCGALLRPVVSTSVLAMQKKQKRIEMKKMSENNCNSTTSDSCNNNNTQNKIVQAYTGSVCSLENKQANLQDVDRPFWKRNKFCIVTIGILKEMTDFKLLCQNTCFLMITLSNLFIFIGYFTPFLYITKIATENGVSKERASFLISIIGIVNIPARMIYGFVADRKIISAINLNTFSAVISTLPLYFFGILQYHYWSQIIFSITFALGIAGLNSLTTMYLCDMVGLKKFGNATGIINLFRGFGCFLGPFLGGVFAGEYGHIYAFYFSAICFTLGTILSFMVSFINIIQGCLKRNNTSSNDLQVRVTGDESDLSKNLLNRRN